MCGLDSIRTNQPYAGGITIAVLDPAEALTRGSIHDAIVERRTYASTGPQLPAALEWTRNGVLLGGMGDEIAWSPGAALFGKVLTPSAYNASILSVTFVGPDSSVAAVETNPGIWRARLPSAQVQAWYYVDIEIDGDLWWVGVGGCEDGGGDAIEHVWLTPTWFD